MTPKVWALGYASKGFHVLPVRSLNERGGCDCGGGCGDETKWAKHPRTQHGWQDATTDPDQIRQWWEWWPTANVGVATLGELVVIDLDPRNGSEETWPALLDGREVPETPLAMTGSGGLHYWFRGSVTRQGRDALGPGVDIKATVEGRSGYVLAPPSRTAAGGYEWIMVGVPLAPLPEWLHPEPPSRPQLTIANVTEESSVPYAVAALRAEARQASQRRDGEGRRDGLFEAGLKLARLCPPLRGDEILAVLTAAARESGLSDREARPHIENGLATGFRAVGA
jgi:Bifunctional DNA primase/polymerase, N-terminal